MRRADMPAGELAQCTSCHTRCVWATTDTGSKMLVDLDAEAGGTVRLTLTPDSKRLNAHVLDAKLAFGHTDLHRAHFATCPNADRHRTRRPARPAKRNR